MFRVKPRAYPPTHQRRTTRRHNSNSSSTTQQARTTAEAVAAKAKRVIDQVATLTVTSTQAGASMVPRDPWESQVPAKSVCLVWPSKFFSTKRLCTASLMSLDHLALLGILAPLAGSSLPSSLPSVFPTYLPTLPSRSNSNIPHMAGGRAFPMFSFIMFPPFFSKLGSIGHIWGVVLNRQTYAGRDTVEFCSKASWQL